jgi:hypothetical protein
LKTEFVKSETNQPHPPSGWHEYQTDSGEVLIFLLSFFKNSIILSCRDITMMRKDRKLLAIDLSSVINRMILETYKSCRYDSF